MDEVIDRRVWRCDGFFAGAPSQQQKISFPSAMYDAPALPCTLSRGFGVCCCAQRKIGSVGKRPRGTDSKIRRMIIFVLLASCITHALAFSPPLNQAQSYSPSGARLVTGRPSTKLNNNTDETRRSVLSQTLLSTSLLIPSFANAASSPVQRAVGSGEKRCREEGNCLETLELDGAVGWNWGGTERCDASDPNCGPDGRVREEPLVGKAVPDLSGLEITHVIDLTLNIGSGSNAYIETIKMGLYGNNCPALVKEMVDICGRGGFVTSKNLLLGAPVRIGGFGTLTYIKPDERLEFGVTSQKVAYAKSIRKAKAPDEFVPQPRPSGERLELARAESSTRQHDVAGLISVPKEGIGYGTFLSGSDDEAYSNAFQITAASAPDMDKDRKVIGQLLDAKSMDTLARLAGLPTRKLLPTQSGGSPLFKVTVDDSVVIAKSDLAAKE